MGLMTICLYSTVLYNNVRRRARRLVEKMKTCAESLRGLNSHEIIMLFSCDIFFKKKITCFSFMYRKQCDCLSIATRVHAILIRFSILFIIDFGYFRPSYDSRKSIIPNAINVICRCNNDIRKSTRRYKKNSYLLQ